MKRAAQIGISLALGSISLVGQTAAPDSAREGPEAHHSQPQVFVFDGPRTAGCPVALHALQGSGAGLVKVRGRFGPLPGTATQHIHLVVSSPKASQARVTFFGRSDKKRLEQTQLSNFGGYELVRTLDVTFSTGDDNSEATDLVLPGFTSVGLVQLESITYRDGSTWTGASQACQITPDRLMLIADR